MTAREIAALFEDLELRLISSLKRNLARHKAEEKDEGFDWPAWQAEKLRSLQRFRRENKAIMAEYSDQIDAETRALMRRQFSEADGSAGAFFGVNARKLDALIDGITHSEARVERAALRYMDDVYRKTILRAAAALDAGGMTVQQATDLATKDFLAQGINCVRYKNGRMVNIASYAEMALRTNSTRAMLLGEAQLRERMNIDTVLVSQYGGCSETCLPWQGRVYIDDVWQPYHGGGRNFGGTYGYSRNGRSYPLLSVAVRAGLFHPNCRHHLTTWVEGVNVRPEPMDRAAVERTARLEARQRELERRVRKYKRLAEGTLEPEKAAGYRRAVRAAQKDVREFVDEHGDVLRRDYWRERYDGTEQPKAADVTIQGHTLYSVTDSAIQAVPKPFFQGLSNRMNTQAQAYAREILSSVKGLPEGTEATISFSLDGSLVKRASGTTDDMSVSIQDLKERYVALHNHPSNDILSPEDVAALIRHDNMAALGAVGNKGALFTCEKVFGYNKQKAMGFFQKIADQYPAFRFDLEQRFSFMKSFEEGAEKYGLHFTSVR